jgi:hypothetical protein
MKGSVLTYTKYSPGICLDRLGKPTKILNQNIQGLVRYSNETLPEYKYITLHLNQSARNLLLLFFFSVILVFTKIFKLRLILKTKAT